MSQRIKLVRGDNFPYVTLTLTNADSTPLDVSAATCAVAFRKEGTTNVLATLPCTNVSGGADGVIKFNFPSTSLDVPAGLYEGEVEITFAGGRQTVYDLLKFTVREKVA